MVVRPRVKVKGLVSGGRSPKKNKRSPRMVPVLSPEVPAEDRLAHVIHLLAVERDPICTLRRQLNDTDAAQEQARLQIAHRDVRCLLECAAVTDAEKALMADASRKLAVAAYDRKGNWYEMMFSRVASIKTGNGVYRLTGGFGQFLKVSGMGEGHTLVVWVLRLPPPRTTPETAAVGALAMVMLDYKTGDEAEVKALEEADQSALHDGMAATALLQLASGA